MKKLVMAGLIIAGSVFVASAADQTLEEYLSQKREAAERKGKPFNEGKLRNAFAERDANHDGVLTADEERAYHAAKAGDSEE